MSRSVLDINTVVPTPHDARLRTKRIIATLLISSVFVATVAISGANGMFGQQWKRASLRAWHQASLAAVQVSDLSSEYQDTLLPIRVIGFFRSNPRATVAEPATASATSLHTAGSAPVTRARRTGW